MLVLATSDGTRVGPWARLSPRGAPAPPVRLAHRTARVVVLRERHLRAVAEEQGVFVCLDAFFKAVTFEPGSVRDGELVRLEDLPLAAPNGGTVELHEPAHPQPITWR